MTTALGTIFTALGYLTGTAVFYLAARRRGTATEGFACVAAAGFCGGVFGAKVTAWVLLHWPGFAANPGAILNPWLGGRTIIGGIFAGWAAVELAKRHLGIRRSTGDLFALALPAGEVIGRIGNFFNGDCYGTVSRLPWAVYQHGAWRHPAQLYSSAVALAIFLLLWRLRDRMPREGDLFRTYIILFGAGRFAVEFFRESAAGPGALSLAQWVALEMVVIGALTWIVSARRRRAGSVVRPRLAMSSHGLAEGGPGTVRAVDSIGIGAKALLTDSFR